MKLSEGLLTALVQTHLGGHEVSRRQLGSDGLVIGAHPELGQQVHVIPAQPRGETLYCTVLYCTVLYCTVVPPYSARAIMSPMCAILSSLSSEPTLAGMPQQLSASTFRPGTGVSILMLEWYVVTFKSLTYHIFEVEEVGYHYGRQQGAQPKQTDDQPSSSLAEIFT